MRETPRGGVATRPAGRVRRVLLVGAIVVAAVTALWSAPAPVASAAPSSPCKVLGLASTLAGGASSVEMQQAAARGCTVEVVDAAGWAAKTPTQFGQYRALILGDPDCSGGPAQVQAATDTIDKWGPRVTGNVIINGTDPVVHPPGGNELTQRGIDFAIDDPANTGMYISLSCYYPGVAPNTPVEVLDAFAPDAFTVKGVGCFNDSHIVATHAALSGLTDADLSNWSCSVHEAFDSWDETSFLVLAIAENAGGEYNAPDGTVGTPYILARGQDLRPLSDITLTQSQPTRPVNKTHTMIATVVDDVPEGEAAAAAVEPVNGKEVTFTILSGPGSPRTAKATTGSAGDGQAAFKFTSGTPGPTRVEASFVDDEAATQKSNVLTVVWEKVGAGGATRAPDYRLAGGDGGVFALGGSKFLGTADFSSAILSPSGVELPSGISGLAATPSGLGYYLAGGDGAVYAFNAPFRGSVYGLALEGAIVDMAVHPSGAGYYLLGEDGGIFAIGVPYYGAVTDFPHNGKAVGIAVTPSGNGYYVIMSDGGVYAFGGAVFRGSMFGLPRNGAIVDLAANPAGRGVWVATSDGGVYALGAPFFGSAGNIALERPIVGIAPKKSGGGYWLASDEGGVFAYGSALFKGSIANGTTPVPGPGCCSRLNAPIIAIAS